MQKMVCRQLVSICRPELLEPELFPASAAGGLPISAGGSSPNKTRRRSWASSDYLADRLQYFSKYMKVSCCSASSLLHHMHCRMCCLRNTLSATVCTRCRYSLILAKQYASMASLLQVYCKVLCSCLGPSMSAHFFKCWLRVCLNLRQTDCYPAALLLLQRCTTLRGKRHGTAISAN